MKIKTTFFLILIILFGCQNDRNNITLEIMAGSAMKPPLEEIVKAFKKSEHKNCIIHYGGSGEILSRILAYKRGDIYIPGSDDFMVKAEEKGIINKNSVKQIAYLIPSITVHKGNPKKIRNLRDLLMPGIKIAIGNPEGVCIGLYAIEIFKKNNLLKDIQKNIVTEAESCEKIAYLVSLGLVDAAIGWRDFENWDKNNIESINLKNSEINRIAVVPVGITIYNKNSDLARKFINFMSGNKGREILKRYGYIVDEKEAISYGLPDTPIGTI